MKKYFNNFIVYMMYNNKKAIIYSYTINAVENISNCVWLAKFLSTK